LDAKYERGENQSLVHRTKNKTTGVENTVVFARNHKKLNRNLRLACANSWQGGTPLGMKSDSIGENNGGKQILRGASWRRPHEIHSHSQASLDGALVLVEGVGSILEQRHLLEPAGAKSGFVLKK